ncbi:caspase family protein [Arthrobacter sp. MDT2-16]
MTKRAVVVGIADYSIQFPANNRNLFTPVNDARSIYHLLQDSFGFQAADIFFYADHDATRDNILSAVSYITSIAQPGDVALFYFSGHGARIRADAGNRDADSYYEALVPAVGDFITDWEFAKIAEKLQPEVCNFTLVIDCCHSGGLHESDELTKAGSLPYSQELIDLICANMRTLIPVGICLPPSAHGELTGNVSNVHPGPNGLIDCDEDPDRTLVPSSKSTLLSAAQFNELAWQPRSATAHAFLTQALLDIFNQSTPTQPSYRQVQDRVRPRVEEKVTTLVRPKHPGVTQVPQLRGQRNRMDEEFLKGWTFTPA